MGFGSIALTHINLHICAGVIAPHKLGKYHCHQNEVHYICSLFEKSTLGNPRPCSIPSLRGTDHSPYPFKPIPARNCDIFKEEIEYIYL